MLDRLVKIGFLTVAIVLFIGCSGAKKEKPVVQTPEQQLVTAMNDVVDLVERGEYKAMFEKYTPPPDLERLKTNKSLDSAIEQFKIFRKDFVRAMKEAQAIQPTFNEDTTRAVYELTEVEVPGHKVVFAKIGDNWYFSD